MNERLHSMIIVGTDALTGTGEWVCPTCGRRVRLGPNTSFRQVVLEPGAEKEYHMDAAGVLSIGGPKTGW